VRQGDVIAGRYEIVQRAGEGGMGAIYRALDHARGGQVAIKVLRRAEEIDVARFQREARLLAQTSHPAIVTFVDHGFDEDRDPYLVMEWLAGETLADRLAGDGVSAQEAVALMRRIAEALGELHRLGIVHRDVKPENIVFPAGALDGAKLIDFGLARHHTGTQTLTQTGAAVGTPAYMAPEQARGYTVDARADVFALGCVLYECLTGVPPFSGSTRTAVLVKLMFCDIPRIGPRDHALPDALVGVVESMMARAPGDRFVDGAAVAAALGGLAIPESARRRGRRDAAWTPLTQPDLVFACVILVEGGLPHDPGIADDVRLEKLANGALAIVVDRGHPADQVGAARRLARKLARAAPERAIAIAGGGGPLERVIERAAALLTEHAIARAIDSGVSPIALEPALERLVDGRPSRADDGAR
jgi:hypothetical protein